VGRTTGANDRIIFNSGDRVPP